MSPCQMGQFPAASLMYRQGLVKTGDRMADLPMKLSDAIALKGSKLVQQSNLDAFRTTDTQDVGETSDAGIDPLIHFVGDAQIRIDGTRGQACRERHRFLYQREGPDRYEFHGRTEAELWEGRLDDQRAGRTGSQRHAEGGRRSGD